MKKFIRYIYYTCILLLQNINRHKRDKLIINSSARVFDNIYANLSGFFFPELEKNRNPRKEYKSRLGEEEGESVAVDFVKNLEL